MHDKQVDSVEVSLHFPGRRQKKTFWSLQLVRARERESIRSEDFRARTQGKDGNHTYLIFINYLQNYYNKNPILANDKTEALLKDLNGLKDVMVENLSKLLERDGKIEIIASKAEQLSTTSSTYRKNANKARIKMRNRRIFMIAMGVVIAGVSLHAHKLIQKL